MAFVKYQHIERLGTDEVDGITIGKCYIFPKIDGTNGSLWHDVRLCAGSRNRELALANDNQGFFSAVFGDEKIRNFLKSYPGLRIFCEWLTPHSLKTYRQDAWRKYYIFDVMGCDGIYLHYDDYSKLLDKYGLEYIRPLAIIENPSTEKLLEFLESNHYLIEDGKGAGEGIVIKNYDYRNKYGRQTWAKMVRNEFKEKHNKEMGAPVVGMRMLEEDIVEKYLTEEMIKKTFAKIPEWSSRKIPQLLGTVYHDFVIEEIWHIIKDFKHPKIDFGALYQFIILKIKKTMPEIF